MKYGNVLIKDKQCREVLLILMKRCLETGTVPQQWEIGEVVSLFKKKDPKDPDNYRPITLLDTIYNIYTRMLAGRLTEALEKHLRDTQYGFRKEKSTVQAIHIIRRTLEGLFYKTDIALNLLLCDWSKAFDRVDTLALEEALKAYGINGKFLKAIKSTFERTFKVCGTQGNPDSEWQNQEMGIRQGCPLSPLLFIIMHSWLVIGVEKEIEK